MESTLEQVTRRLAPEARITVLTGAGVSAASGVPTFRGADGLWNGVRVEDMATPEAFARRPRQVSEWYDWRRQHIARVRPNPAHHVLASWGLRFPRFTLITQNVDGLHERAGSAAVLRMHGSIWEVSCWKRCAGAPARWRDDTVPWPELPPPCPHCGGPLRPGVVWFGETLDADVLDRCFDATSCDVFFTIGTSAVVYPAAGLVDLARARGACTIEVNPEATPASTDVDIVVAVPAEEALPAIEARLGPHPLVLETVRLRLEPVLPRDATAMHRLWTDPEVRRYLWDDEVIPFERAEAAALASAADFAAHRFGLWSLIERRTGALAGFCGLRTEGIGDEPELLFGLLPAYWGRGLVQEASRAVLDYVFRTLGLPRVIAATDVANERSARTLAAIGMRLERRGLHDGLDTLFYGIEGLVDAGA